MVPPEQPPEFLGEAVDPLSGLPESVRKRLGSVGSRHHYVPEFLLKRFGVESGRSVHIYQYSIKGKRVSFPSIKDVAVVKDYNTVKTRPKEEAGLIELHFATIEEEAAPVIDALVHGATPSLRGMSDLAVFVAAQQGRTPRGRANSRFMMENAQRFLKMNQIASEDELAKNSLRESLGREPSDGEIAKWQAEMLAMLEHDIKFVAQHDHEVTGQTIGLDKLAEVVFNKEVIVLHAPPAKRFRFILSDEPLVRYDRERPKGNAGWLSSPTFEATLPVDPAVCLLFHTGPSGSVRHVRCPASRVDEGNLRAFAWARQSLFVPSETVLEEVGRQAKANPERIDAFRPHAPNIYLFDEEHPKSLDGATVIPGPTETPIRRD